MNGFYGQSIVATSEANFNLLIDMTFNETADIINESVVLEGIEFKEKVKNVLEKIKSILKTLLGKFKNLLDSLKHKTRSLIYKIKKKIQGKKFTISLPSISINQEKKKNLDQLGDKIIEVDDKFIEYSNKAEDIARKFDSSKRDEFENVFNTYKEYGEKYKELFDRFPEFAKGILIFGEKSKVSESELDSKWGELIDIDRDLFNTFLPLDSDKIEHNIKFAEKEINTAEGELNDDYDEPIYRQYCKDILAINTVFAKTMRNIYTYTANVYKLYFKYVYGPLAKLLGKIYDAAHADEPKYADYDDDFEYEDSEDEESNDDKE